MKLYSGFILCLMIHTITITQEIPDVQSQQEAINVVTQLSEHLADLIIHHKQKIQNPEITKQHSINIIKKLSEIIALCIHKAKAQKAMKSVSLYNQHELNMLLEKIALDMIFKIENQKDDNV